MWIKWKTPWIMGLSIFCHHSKLWFDTKSEQKKNVRSTFSVNRTGIF